LAKESLKLVIRRSIFKIEEDDKSRVNLKYLVYYILLWIVCINNKCKMHKILKAKNYKYLVRMYWMPSELKYRNAEFMYGWHLTEKQQVRAIIMELGRFPIKECLNRRE